MASVFILVAVRCSEFEGRFTRVVSKGYHDKAVANGIVDTMNSLLMDLQTAERSAAKYVRDEAALYDLLKVYDPSIVTEGQYGLMEVHYDVVEVQILAPDIELITALNDARMDPKHDHLNKELEDDDSEG